MALDAPPATASARRDRAWIVVSIGALALTASILAPLRSTLDPGTMALALLVGPLIAAGAGLRSAILVSILGAATFNVVFTRPFGSLRIASSTSVAALAAYVAASLALSVALSRMRRASELSSQRAAEAVLLRDLTLELIRQDVFLRPPLQDAVERLVESLRVRGAALRIEVEGVEQFDVSSGAADRSHRAMLAGLSGIDFERPTPPQDAHLADGIATVPIATERAAYGALAVELSDESVEPESIGRVVTAFANLMALACERAGFVQESVRRQVLERAEEHRVTLVQSVSHDLRTPLTSMRALASTLPDLGPMSPPQLDVLADIENQATRLARMVDQVLDLSRIESGRLTPQLQRMQLDEIVRSAVTAVRPLLAHEDDLTVTLDPDGPAIPVDEPLMRQVLVNLLENSIRHGGPPFEVAVFPVEDRIEIRVVDHGPGIADADRRRMFDAGWAMSRRSADERSTGLGLVVGAGFVRAHRGHIRVDPTQGGGATFVVSLPTKTPRAMTA